jgi:hypothetical protein
MNWILNFIGISIYFVNRFTWRKAKTKFSWGYWLKDNYKEMYTTLFFDIALMMILTMDQVQINMNSFLQEKLPWGISIEPVVGKAIMSLLLGLGFAALIYKYYKLKSKFKK